MEIFPHVHFAWPIKLIVDDFSVFSIGPGGIIGPFSEIVVEKQSPSSRVAGSLSIGAGVRIGMGANIRAAGGTIHIGAGTQIGQHVSMIASNHLVEKNGASARADRWDATKTGISIGEGCWIGAGVVILPGVTIGSAAVIGAGSIVTRSVEERQVWYGNPARPQRNPLPRS